MTKIHELNLEPDPEVVVVRIVVEDDAIAAVLIAELEELAAEGIGTIVSRPS